MEVIATRSAIRVGTRGSKLALLQTEIVLRKLREIVPTTFKVVPITTRGDVEKWAPIGLLGKGVFEREVNQALLNGEVDMVVHSLKDVPIDLPPEITLGAIPDRASPNDVFISSCCHSISELPVGSIVGTSSTRRKAQLLSLRPDVEVVPLRGNVETRLGKVLSGQYDGAIMAEAGLQRLSIHPPIMVRLPLESFPTSPGQGAIAVYVRRSDSDLAKLLSRINSPAYEAEVTAEREFLRALGGGCASPVGCTAVASPVGLKMVAGLYAPDGSASIVRTFIKDSWQNPADFGKAAAATMLNESAVRTFWVRKK